MIAKFIFDRLAAFLLILILAPAWVVISLMIVIDSPGPPFFVQTRVGRRGRLFGLIKFRTMRPNAETGGKLTVGQRDPRVTRVGYGLRRYKIDELPQLFNVLTGRMSFVGPRPEVPEYVALYDDHQRGVLEVRPGLTDYASLRYFDENEVLAAAANPQATYIDTVMPEKLEINLEYIDRRSFWEDMRILWLTVLRILRT